MALPIAFDPTILLIQLAASLPHVFYFYYFSHGGRRRQGVHRRFRGRWAGAVERSMITAGGSRRPRHNAGQVFSFLVERFYHHRFAANRMATDTNAFSRSRSRPDSWRRSGTCGASVGFHRFFAGETSAAVRHGATVGVDLDFAAGLSRIRFKTALHEAPRRVDEYLDIFQRAEDGGEEMFDELFPYFLLRDFFIVLCRTECRNDFAF